VPTESLNCPNSGAVLQVTKYIPTATCAYCNSNIRIIASEHGLKEVSAEADRLTEITIALNRLLMRSNDSGHFVAFKESQSKKFVQFMKNDSLLILDLPSQTLSEKEMERATLFFRYLGAGGVNAMRKYSNLGRAFITFQLKLGQYVETAAQITLAIFRQVYQFPVDFQLVIKED
jgi:hypothetical protein